MDFPNQIEVTCPCCNSYRHMTKKELCDTKHRKLRSREVVCTDCWRVFKVLYRRYKKVKE